jgi:hypothetical protein
MAPAALVDKMLPRRDEGVVEVLRRCELQRKEEIDGEFQWRARARWLLAKVGENGEKGGSGPCVRSRRRRGAWMARDARAGELCGGRCGAVAEPEIGEASR